VNQLTPLESLSPISLFVIFS